MKKLIAITMTMIMMVSLVGCGGNTSSSSTENEVNSQVSTDIIVKAATDVTVNTNADTKVNTADAAVDTTTNTNVETKVNTVDTTVDTTVENSANTDTAVAPQEQDDGIAGQTLNEYLATENRTPRYFYISPFSEDWEELVELYPEVLLEIKTIFVYFGELYPFPFPGDEVIAIPINFGDEIWEMTNEDLIYAINSYQIAEVIEVPDFLTTIISKYTDLEVDITSVAEEGRMYDDSGRSTLRWFMNGWYDGQEPRFIIYDTSDGTFKELTEENKAQILETFTVYAYFGSNALPQDDEQVALLSPYLNRSIDEMSLEEVVESLKDSTVIIFNTFDSFFNTY